MRNVRQTALAAAWYLATAALSLAQPTVAPSPEKAGSAKGNDLDGYNVVNSWEIGYRTRTVRGNEGKYRSDVNFGNGVRLLSNYLGMFSKDGRGRLFDELVLTTQGLGNDPYQFANLRVRKNKTYEYNFNWRWNTYYNPALAISGGQHFLDTSHRWQDHDLVLRPDTKLKGIFGYSRNFLEGPGLTTTNLFGRLGDEFPLFTNIRRERNEYRLGGELDLQRLRLRIIRAWENFKEDTPAALSGPSEGNNPDDTIALRDFRKAEPYRGNAPSWRGSLTSEPSRWLSIVARGTYTGADSDFLVDETAVGSRFGRQFDRQVLVFGTGRRPVGTGSATISVFPTRRLTVANHSAYYNVRMEGDSVFQEFSNRTLDFDQIAFQSLGIRTIVNTTDVNFRARAWLGVYGGYHYSTRRIRSRELLIVGDFEETVEAQQENNIHSGIAGIRLQPVKPLTINLEGEIGSASQPFFPVSEKNYHLIGGRIQYKNRTLLFSAATRINYNTNSVSLSAHSARSRNYAFDFSWTPSARFAVDAGYNKMHLNTLSGIAYFAAFRPVTGERSVYISNIHSVHTGFTATITKRLDFYAGYTRVQDTGDGRESAATPPAGADPGSALPSFRAAQTFPVIFQSPLARLTFQLHERLHWNVGYQFYHYKEEFSTLQNYRAHTGYTSVVWSF